MSSNSFLEKLTFIKEELQHSRGKLILLHMETDVNVNNMDIKDDVCVVSSLRNPFNRYFSPYFDIEKTRYFQVLRAQTLSPISSKLPQLDHKLSHRGKDTHYKLFDSIFECKFNGPL